MVTRNKRAVYDPSLPPNVRKAREALARKGWSHAAAAEVLGRSRPHLTLVLTGKRESRRLLAEIHALPNRKS